ncbi:YqaE/Pmp3 family membrane protein [Vibrio sp. CAU 1672]|uniref:YqaE/Pmp3 family membrane protein n=1 Tax=Vibrio sp. CAU 1672 TaxID=3032594 RepID=UPI0023DC7CE4|nr:YqaE/Pmp3 family membrane protein [Vibrio sp. CAU 1672]MDF2155159.1 YqaE/Pmp3 family membrane protein [Vibrio sp. CAU 1672]
MPSRKILIILLCLCLPPAAVYMVKGFDKHFLINLFLTFFLFFLPGCIHAFWVTMKLTSEPSD